MMQTTEIEQIATTAATPTPTAVVQAAGLVLARLESSEHARFLDVVADLCQAHDISPCRQSNTNRDGSRRRLEHHRKRAGYLVVEDSVGFEAWDEVECGGVTCCAPAEMRA